MAEFNQARVEKHLEELMIDHNEEMAIAGALRQHADDHDRNVRNLKLHINRLNAYLDASLAAEREN